MNTPNKAAGQPADTQPNELIHSNSLYLQQHAYNPVRWRMWGEEAMQAAEAEGKLLLISIGYSACHWCHVMAHECFEDAATARYMNENFICVKVDREEHPAVDHLYMDACVLTTGRGGWPLNAFALPDGRPVYAGTYFPKPQWTGLMRELSSGYRHKRADFLAYADKLQAGLKGMNIIPQGDEGGATLTMETMRRAWPSFSGHFDTQEGGRMPAPKFPMPDNWQLALDFAAATDNAEAEQQTLLTLEKMARGGIYDQVEGGFARYSVDDIWHVPHFEKMLYDNAQLIPLYARAAALLPENDARAPLFREVLRNTIAFLDKEMSDPDTGLYYAALDADSDGKEGAYYIFSDEAFAAAIPPNELSAARTFFGADGPAWWAEENAWVLTRPKTELPEPKHETIEAWKKALTHSRRENNSLPGLDKKIILGWNCLMISGLIKAEWYAGQQATAAAVQKLYTLENRCLLDSPLRYGRVAGEANMKATLDDYALLAQAWIDAFQYAGEAQGLQKAIDIAEYCMNTFKADGDIFFNFSPLADKSIPLQKIDVQDNVIASSNSVMARVLYRLGLFAERPEYIAQAANMCSAMAAQMEDHLSYFSNWGRLALQIAQGKHSLIHIGPLSEEANRRAIAFAEGRCEILLIEKIHEYASVPAVGGKESGQFYVCGEYGCQAPVSTLKEALALLPAK